MTIANALKEFFFKLNGTKPSGNNISEVIRNGASGVETEKTELILKSSTKDSSKRFNITVTDDGTISATEIVAE